MFILAPTNPTHLRQSALTPHLTWLLTESNPLAENHRCEKQRENVNCRANFSSHRAHVSEDDKSLFVSFDVPGMKADDLQVVLNECVLNVNGKRPNNGDNLFSTFQKKIKLDHHCLDTAQTEARLSDGVLVVRLAKKKEADPFKLSVIKDDPPAQLDNFSLRMDVPGVKANDLTVEYATGRIRIQGHRTVGRTSTFQRTVVVDSANIDVMNMASYLNHGVLTIIAPKKESCPERTIEIQTDDDDANEYVSVSGIEKEDIEVETVRVDEESTNTPNKEKDSNDDSKTA